MALPVIAAGLLARILLRGGIAAARKYAKKKGFSISANALKKARIINKANKAKSAASTAKKARGLGTKTKTKPVTKTKPKLTNLEA